MSLRIRGKKILVLIPDFYGYEKFIIEELQNAGADTRLICTNLYKTNKCYRHFIRYLPIIRELFRTWYFWNSFKKLKSIDIVFMITEATVDKCFVMQLKRKFRHSKYILYLWDSVKNCPNVLQYYTMFHKVLTFDFADAKKYGWKYKPLFYIEQFLGESKKKYDFSFICTAFDERLSMLADLKKIADKNKLHPFFYVYCTRLRYIKFKYLLRRKEYQKISYKDLKFKPLSLADTNKVYRQSACVIDCVSGKQEGMTMRTIECLGHKCKLITNNRNIKDADFYHESNIMLYNEYLNDIPKKFCRKAYRNIDASVYSSYSLKNWIGGIFYE